MKTLVALSALVAASLSILTAGCEFDPGGCDPAPAPRRTAAFTPSSVEARRLPEACGALDAPYAASDLFMFEIVGEKDVPPPFTTLTLDLSASVAIDQPIPLALPAPSDSATPPAMQTASTADSSVSFTFATGSKTSEIDATAMTSVVVTVLSMPTADGQPMSAEIQIRFRDGVLFDKTFTAPIATSFVSCPVPVESGAHAAE